LLQNQKMMIPTLDNNLISFVKSLDCTWVGAVPVISKPFCKEWNCHNNTINYSEWYGGQRIIGYYLLEDIDRYIAVLHSIIVTFNNKFIDITPFSDNRKYNIFCVLRNQTPCYEKQEVIHYKDFDAKMDVTDSSFTGISL